MTAELATYSFNRCEIKCTYKDVWNWQILRRKKDIKSPNDYHSKSCFYILRCCYSGPNC